ncbi:hypothetical protein PROFUN_14661, partial [Planoprotostelium fungivorum]
NHFYVGLTYLYAWELRKQTCARTICIVFVNRDIYRWNQRSLLSQKQVRKLVVMPRALFGNSARKAIFHLGKIYHWDQDKETGIGMGEDEEFIDMDTDSTVWKTDTCMKL